MNATKTLICILTAGAALGAAAPVFADSAHERGHDRDRYSYYDRHDNRNYNRDYYRNYDRRHFIAVRRPYFIEQPVYYREPAPVAYFGPGAIIGAAIGGYIDSRQ
jgi:hypothetical protein